MVKDEADETLYNGLEVSNGNDLLTVLKGAMTAAEPTTAAPAVEAPTEIVSTEWLDMPAPREWQTWRVTVGIAAAVLAVCGVVAALVAWPDDQPQAAITPPSSAVGAPVPPPTVTVTAAPPTVQAAPTAAPPATATITATQTVQAAPLPTLLPTVVPTVPSRFVSVPGRPDLCLDTAFNVQVPNVPGGGSRWASC